MSKTLVILCAVPLEDGEDPQELTDRVLDAWPVGVIGRDGAASYAVHEGSINRAFFLARTALDPSLKP